MKSDWLALVSGIALIIIGLIIIIASKFHIVGIIYGVLAILIGICILVFSNQESEIEQIKSKRRKK
ncbi:MAG: hypothetical protein ABIH72_04690 [archaeon]